MTTTTAEAVFKHSAEVDLVDWMGSDDSVVQAARVSVVGTSEAEYAEAHGLIRYLAAHRHGTPFEHTSIKVRVSAPIFVWREWMRHRIGFSYNEESGRYKQLEPVFHVPAPDRPLVNAGTSARPRMVPGTPEQYERQVYRMKRAFLFAYEDYLAALEDGVAKEVAREVLPVATFSSAYVTFNLRSAFAFLSLRVHDPDAAFVSYPQYEIEQAARQVEAIVARLFPISHEAFVAGGRVAP